MKLLKTKLGLAMWVVGTIILVAIIILFFQGYRIKNWQVISPGSITIRVSEDDSKLFINNAFKRTAKSGQQVTIGGLASGYHTILVAKDEFWPWEKQISVPSEKNLTLDAFILPKNVSGFVLTKNAEVNAIKSKVDRQGAPQKSNKKLSDDKNMAIWSEQGFIKAEWRGPLPPAEYFCDYQCPTEINIMKPLTGVRNLDFYKNYNNIFVVASGPAIYVVEADQRGRQNFQPIYIGKEPRFIKKDNNVLYVSDTGNLMEVQM